MKLPKTKTLVKYAVIVYLAHLCYSIPRTDWEAEIVVTEMNAAGVPIRYVPQQSSYIKYMLAWWRTNIKTKGATGIIDEYILAPLGIDMN